MVENKQKATDPMDEEIDQLIEYLVSEGYAMNDIEELLTDDEFLQKLEELDATFPEEAEPAEVPEAADSPQATGATVETEAPEEAELTTLQRLSKLTGKTYEPRELTEDERKRMWKNITYGQAEWGRCGPITAKAAIAQLNKVPEDERDQVMLAVYEDEESYRYLITLH